MTAFIEDLRTAQAACAETMLMPLWAHIGLQVAVVPSALANFVDQFESEDLFLDAEAVRLSYEKEVELQAFKAVEGYVDWVASRIVRSESYEPCDLPVPSVVDVLAITGKYDVKPAILSFVIERLREDDAVPLLGKMKDGLLVPDEPALREWASYYDWGDQDATA